MKSTGTKVTTWFSIISLGTAVFAIYDGKTSKAAEQALPARVATLETTVSIAVKKVDDVERNQIETKVISEQLGKRLDRFENKMDRLSGDVQNIAIAVGVKQ